MENINHEKPQAVIVRTFSAGVHFGYLTKRDGKEVHLENSRRIWKWAGALSCSELASDGLNIENSKVASRVSIILTEAIEIINCTQKSIDIMERAHE